MSKLWGGRFSKETNKLVEEFTKSIHYDYKLAKFDVLASQVHVAILEKAGYLTPPEAKKLFNALQNIYQSIKEGKFEPDMACEDVHTDIQNKIQKETGDLALKLHTARSRNDQVVVAVKLYCKNEIIQIKFALEQLIQTIVKLSSQYEGVIIPGFTHLQHAQPVYLKDHLNAYVQMLLRDGKRLQHISDNIEIAMGAGALAGTPVPDILYHLKPNEVVKDLEGTFNFTATKNSLDSVSDRDFVIEIISALSIVAMHLSRLSEDLIIWCTKEFDFIELDDAFCTGSSLMPQKKNPDVLELIRGHAGRLYGNLVSVLTMMKGLPLTYNRDMQLDKEPLFNSFEIVSKELEVLAGLMETLKFNKDKIKEHLKDESLYATDLVYYLVDKGVAFKEAHTIIGELVRYAMDSGTKIQDLPENILKEKFSDKIVKSEFVLLFDPKRSVESKKSIKRDKI